MIGVITILRCLSSPEVKYERKRERSVLCSVLWFYNTSLKIQNQKVKLIKIGNQFTTYKISKLQSARNGIQNIGIKKTERHKYI